MTEVPVKPRKPEKPYTGFPLTAHPNGQWCKKIRGKVHFFGVWAEPMMALDQYNRHAADLHAGRVPRRKDDSDDVPTVKDLCNTYLAAQAEKVDRGLITPTFFGSSLNLLREFAQFVGKERRWDDVRAEDFERYRLHLYDRLGVHAITRAVTIVRSVFKYAYDSDLIDRPVKYGGRFAKPSLREFRRSRGQRDRANGKRLFTPGQVRSLLSAADAQLKAMILLGINGGFGNTDCGELPITAVDLSARLIEYERPKTGVPRVVPLWDETVVALRAVLEGKRPVPRAPEDARLVFLTKYGHPWKRERLVSTEGQDAKAVRHDSVSAEFKKLLEERGLARTGLGFYALRHTFRTWADEYHDQHAIHRIMGHAIPGMSGIYVEEITVNRLRAVVEHVHNTLLSQ